MQTLLLDTDVWDLVLDSAGNIAVASDPYAMAQDIASACRLFQGELWYNTLLGIPYFEQILGHAPPVALIKSRLNAAAMTVPGIASSQTFISIGADRTVTGQVQATSVAGVLIAVGVPLTGAGNPFIIGISRIGQGSIA